MGKNKILKTIFSSFNKESSILISTHLVRDTEELFDEVVFINNGKIVYKDSAENIRENKKMSIEKCYLEVFSNV